MISKISFLMAVFVACSSASANCPHGWTTILNLNKCYKFFTQRMQWYDAENFCVSQGPGGHLVSIHSRFENNALLDLAAATPGSEAGEAWFWIGMNNLRTTSSYTWIDGSSTDFTAWVQGEPSQTSIEYCACMEDKKSTCPSCWRTQGCFSCQDFRYFICQINGM